MATEMKRSNTDTRQPPPAETLTVRRPADGAVAGEVPVHSVADVAAKAAALRAAQPEWEAIGPKGRAVWMGRFRDWILDNQERLTELLMAESGKSWQDAAIEVPASVDAINYFSANAGKFLADRKVRPHGPAYATKRLTVAYRPQPLVGVITPWNFPFAAPLLDIPGALAAGCAVLSKPSEVVPLVWSEAVRGWREDVGAPLVLDCATGWGETGAAVVDAVDMVQFTGSTATGRKIAGSCAERLIPCSLELGGKDAMIVLADADLERAANGAVWGGFYNAGQVCISVERVFVERPVYDEFIALVTEKSRSLRQGPDEARFGVEVGAMATEAQLGIVTRHVDDAVASGAKAVTGGQRRPGRGLFFEPTVLVDVNPSMACMQEETFGPTLPVMPVADAAEAIRRTNDSPYGLSASVWSKDNAKAEAVARKLEVGAVNINNVLMNAFMLSVPMGGWKASGLGARHGGAYGVQKYCRSQTIVADRVLEPKSELNWYPYSVRKGKLQERVTRLLGGRDLKRRLRRGG